jgi:hypothetical protein
MSKGVKGILLVVAITLLPYLLLLILWISDQFYGTNFYTGYF